VDEAEGRAIGQSNACRRGDLGVIWCVGGVVGMAAEWLVVKIGLKNDSDSVAM
jgi:hypothetical protein